MSLTPLQRYRLLEKAQCRIEDEFERFKARLRAHRRSGNEPQTDNCCQTLDYLDEMVRSASWDTHWELNPADLVQSAIDQVQTFRKMQILYFMSVLRKLKEELETLHRHQVP
jgi:hypothetical protein